MNIKKLFGENVRNIRKQKGLTQEKVSHKANLHHTYIGAVERGEVNITLENLIKIAKGLDISPAQLFVLSPGQTKKDEIESLRSQIISFTSESDPKKLKLAVKILKDIFN